MRDSIYRSGVVFPKLRPFCQLVTVPNVSQMQLAPTTTLAAMPCLPRCLHHTSHNAAAAAATINPRSATADVGRMVRSRRRPHATAGLPYGTHYQSLWSLRAGMAACPSDLAAAPCASSAKAQPTWTHHVSGGWPDSWLPYRLAKSPVLPTLLRSPPCPSPPHTPPPHQVPDLNLRQLVACSHAPSPTAPYAHFVPVNAVDPSYTSPPNQNFRYR